MSKDVVGILYNCRNIVNQYTNDVQLAQNITEAIQELKAPPENTEVVIVDLKLHQNGQLTCRLLMHSNNVELFASDLGTIVRLIVNCKYNLIDATDVLAKLVDNFKFVRNVS